MKTAMIQCILERKGGSVVTIDKTVYHFKPDLDGKHIAPVTDADHIARFLQIPEAYRLDGVSDGSASGLSGVAAAAATAPVAAVVTPPVTNVTEPSQPVENIAETGVTGDVTAVTGDEPAHPADDAAPTGPAKLDASEDEMADMDIESVRAIFRIVVGREPNPRAKNETMVAQIVAKREEATGKQ